MDSFHVLGANAQGQQAEEALLGVGLLVLEQGHEQVVTGRLAARLCFGAREEHETPIEQAQRGFEGARAGALQDRPVEHHLGVGGQTIQGTQDLVAHHAVRLREQVLLEGPGRGRGLEPAQGPRQMQAQLMGQRPVTVKLLTNRTTAAERRELFAALQAGTVDLLIGTHALISEGVTFGDLGMVVIDEQHRFGVEQRSALKAKGNGRDPDVLVMTATPIPRTAAMTVYGDLDSTILDELPPGRTPILTHWARTDLEEANCYTHVREEVEAGRQAYVVCPLVDESEKIQAKSATETLEELSGGYLEGLRLGLLHGQMPSALKESTMNDFRARKIDVLVATTVIEVGVDVPNATVMVIQDADRFGIAQLHQLRGRVGRGAQKSFCYLLADPSTTDGEERLKAIEASTDGFELAEIDLELRGEGTILGTRQKGRTDLKLASLRRDKKLVVEARRVATEIVNSDPELANHPELKDEIQLFVDPDEAEFLFKS